jgi:divalent metal cation (Fe/Co/Zn/Cd) transporter
VVGLAVALAGIVATWVTGNAVWDGVATIAIGALLCLVAAVLTAEMKRLLIGETVAPASLEELRQAISGVDGVERVLNLRTEHLGPKEVLVCVKVALCEPANLQRVVDVVNAVERAVHDTVPDTLMCYVEPDRFDRNRLDLEWT